MTLGFDLRDLQLFAAVAEAGSITRGAERSYLSLPAASARLQSMEQQIGTRLLTRGRRGVTLTAAGRLLREHTVIVLSQVDRMQGDLARFAEGMVASMRLQANTAAIDTFLPDQLVTFLRERPDVDIDLRERRSDEIVHALAQGHADLGIVTSTVDTGALICRPLIDDRLVAAVAPGHELAERDRVTYADCLAHPLVGLIESRALAEHLELRARPHGDRPAHRIRLPTIAAVCNAVAAGLGVAVIPHRIARQPLPRGTIITVDLDDPWADRTLLLVHARRPQISDVARALQAHLLSAGNSSRTA